MRKTRKDYIVGAAEALHDLNTFAIIISILEGGHVHTKTYAAADRIIKICKDVSQRALRDYDDNVERAME